jgi:hypothetical protein
VDMGDEEDSSADSGEYTATFEGCTCDHDASSHEWGGGCPVEGCDCEGSWTE